MDMRPAVIADGLAVNLLFAGSCLVEMESPGQVLIDGKTYGPGETLDLERPA